MDYNDNAGSFYESSYGDPSLECIDLASDSDEDEQETAEYVQPVAVYQASTSKGPKPKIRSNPTQNKRLYQRNRLYLSLSFDCTDCEQTAISSENLYKKHLRDDHSIYNHRCYVAFCGHSFKRKCVVSLQMFLAFTNNFTIFFSIFLQQHLEKVHPNEFNWICATCQQSHTSHDELKKHFTSCHQFGTFVCNFKGGCQVETFNREQMLQHLREYHVLDPEGKVTPKNYICNFQGCEQAFSTSALVRRHQLFHLKIKPYSCKLCSYESEVRYATIVHIRTVHMGLPAYVRDQEAKNIVDKRDPASFLHVEADKLEKINECARNIKRIK